MESDTAQLTWLRYRLICVGHSFCILLPLLIILLGELPSTARVDVDAGRRLAGRSIGAVRVIPPTLTYAISAGMVNGARSQDIKKTLFPCLVSTPSGA